MVTPVYDAVTVDWKTQKCSTYPHAVWRDTCVIFTTAGLGINLLFSITARCILSCYRQVKKYISDNSPSKDGCIDVPLSTTKHQVAAKRSLFQHTISLLCRVPHLAQNNRYHQRGNPFTCYDLARGPGVLWLLAERTRVVIKVRAIYSTVPSKYNQRTTRRSNAA